MKIYEVQNLSTKETREKLMVFPGVGPKATVLFYMINCWYFAGSLFNVFRTESLDKDSKKQF